MRIADAVQISVCEDRKCRCIHIVLSDGNVEIVGAALHVDLLQNMISDLHKAAREIAIYKGDA